MLEQGEVITLENDKDYAVAGTTILDDINYVYLMNMTDYSDFLFCAFDEVDGLYEVEDPELLNQLIAIFDKQLNGERKYDFEVEEEATEDTNENNEGESA